MRQWLCEKIEYVLIKYSWTTIGVMIAASSRNCITLPLIISPLLWLSQQMERIENSICTAEKTSSFRHRIALTHILCMNVSYYTILPLFITDNFNLLHSKFFKHFQSLFFSTDTANAGGKCCCLNDNCSGSFSEVFNLVMSSVRWTETSIMKFSNNKFSFSTSNYSYRVVPP